MKTRTILFLLLCLSLVACTHGPDSDDTDLSTPSIGVPDGYFVATFTSTSSTDPVTREAVTGPDARISDLRYLIFLETGEFVKEKRVTTPADGVQTWPLPVIRDTLARGSYRVVFLGNMEPSLFNGSEVLTGYRDGFANTRIHLPQYEFTDNTEFYMAQATFSDVLPTAEILLQRIIAKLDVSRNFLDAEDALNMLVANIVAQVDYKTILSTTINGLLPGPLTAAVQQIPLASVVLIPVGGVVGAVDLLLGTLLAPVVDLVYDLLLQRLVAAVGSLLAANTESGAGILDILTPLLNPWSSLDGTSAALVTVDGFPSSMDLNLTVTDTFPDGTQFAYSFSPDPNVKSVWIRGFAGTYNITEVNVLKQGLVGGIVVDGILDSSLLLNGDFIDINDPITAVLGVNEWWNADYSFLDLGLKDYTLQTDGEAPLSIDITLSDLTNLDGLLGGIPILGPIIEDVVGTLLGPIKLSVPVNLPLLGIENLSVQGGWSTTQQV